MWFPITLLALAGVVAADYDHAWKAGNDYHYLIRSRTLTGLDQLKNQYTGILIKAQLTVQRQDDQTLRAKVSKAQYAHVHKELPGGWDSRISDQMLELRELPISGKPFEIKMKHGVIRDLIVDKEVPTWEVNILKSIVSQLQVDTQGENAKKSRNTQVPDEDEPYAMFKAMEDSVGGRCEVLYDITPLPEHILDSRPELVPMPKLKGEGHHIDIVKSKNYSRCEQRMDYHFGISGKSNWEPGSNENGRFLSKSSNSRIVISGNLKSFTIQSSVTTNKMFVSPRLYDEQSGMVVSRMNLTLATVSKTANPLPSPNNPESVGNLVYTYNNPFSESDERRPRRPSISESSKPSSDSTSSDSSSEEARRNGQKNGRIDSSSSSSSSSSMSNSQEGDFWQPKPTLADAPQNPLLPLFVGYRGKAISMSNSIDPVKSTKELVQEIANELEDPSNIPSRHTLEKFTILSSLIRTMNRKQIAEAEGNMHLPSNDLKANEKSQAQKQNAWAVFRDAVTQAGSGPALLTIKDWIKEKKIEGMEAAGVVARIPKSARAPTAEYVNAFFELVKSPEVMKQQFLNSSALIAFGDLVRRAQVSRRSIHNRYPVHAFGRLSPKNNQAVLEEYMPFLERELRNAIKAGDSPRIQTYIMALGITGHPKMLGIFEPYLEGKEQVSTFQRTMMVAAISKLAELNPKLARAVLYKIYLNTMEAHEVRCTAVFLLMKTNPPLSMLQRMADFTNYDTSKHVNSAVKSSIESIAKLNNPESRDLAAKANIAQKLLNRSSYGYQYSQGHVTDSIIGKKNLAYKLIMNYIGSEDSMMPRAWYFGLQTAYGGFEEPTFETAAMVSSVKALLEMDLMKKNERDQPEKSITEKIAEALKIEAEDPVQLEGNILWNTKHSINFMPFDNHSIERIPDLAMKALQSLRDQGYTNMNRLVDYETTLSFPTETGLPFVYTLRTSALSKVSGTAKAQISQGSGFNADSEFRVVYSKKLQGRVGFVTPFEHQHFIAGVDTNFQAYAPVKLEVDLNVAKKSIQLKLWPMKGEKNARLIHYSVEPYTAKHDILNLRPILSEKTTQRVHSKEPRTFADDFPSRHVKVFRLQVEGDNQGLNTDSILNSENPMDMLVFPLFQQSDHYRKVELSMNLEKDQEKPVVFKVAFDSMQTDAESGDKDSSAESSAEAKAIAAITKDPNSDARRKQLLKEAAVGIRSAKARVVDIQMETPGEYKTQNGLTLAWASSNVDEKSRTLFYWTVNLPNQDIKYEVCAAGQLKSNANWQQNYAEAIKTKPKTDFNVDVRYGNRCFDGSEISIKGQERQSNELREKIQRSAIVKKCERQMKDGNKGLRACQQAGAIAMIPDELDMTMNLQSEFMQDIAHQAINMVQSTDYADVDVDVVRPRNFAKQKIDIEMKLSEDLNKARVVVRTPTMDATFSDIDVAELGIDSRSKLSANENMDLWELAEDKEKSTCVLDNTQTETFDGKSYPTKLDKCWHVAMTTYKKENPNDPNQSLRIPEDRQVSIVTRETENGHKEVKINLGEKRVRLSSSGSELQAEVNKQKVHISEKKSYKEKNNNKVVFEIFKLPNGAIRLVSEKYEVDVTFDGKRIQIKASDEYRNSVRGLCGNNDGEPDNDFTAPKNCILKSPEEFLASYALTKDECQGPSLEIARRADQFKCTRPTYRMSNVISQREAGKASNENKNWGYHKNDQQYAKRCNTHRTRVELVDDKICFTTRPVPACTASCSPTETKVKNYQFHCMPQNAASLEMKNRVEKGANPDFSQKPVTFNRSIQVPLECRA